MSCIKPSCNDGHEPVLVNTNFLASRRRNRHKHVFCIIQALVLARKTGLSQLCKFCLHHLGRDLYDVQGIMLMQTIDAVWPSVLLRCMTSHHSTKLGSLPLPTRSMPTSIRMFECCWMVLMMILTALVRHGKSNLHAEGDGMSGTTVSHHCAIYT